MKARVKATGEYVEVKPERDGYFIDEANSNPYKFEELDFIDTSDQQSNMFAGLFGSMLNPLAGLDKSMDSQFWVSKHSECIFKLLDLLKDRFVEFDDRLSHALVYARCIISDMKAFKDGQGFLTEQCKKDKE